MRSRQLQRTSLVLGPIVLLAAVAASGVQAATLKVAASNYVFTPGSTSIHLGDTVTWTFAGEPHSVTSGTAPGGVGQPDGKFDSGVMTAGGTFTLGPGGASNPFTAPGTYPYFCQIHPEQMHGTIVVLANTTPPPKATPRPTPRPTLRPTPAPTPVVTPAPSPSPSASPSAEPSAAASPELSPSASPSESPSTTPSPSATPGPDGGDGGRAPALLAVTAVLAALAIGGAALYLRRGRAT